MYYFVIFETDIDSPERNKEDVVRLIKSEKDWCRLTRGCYVVESSMKPVGLRDKYLKALSPNDLLFVVPLKDAPMAWQCGVQGVGLWLKDRLTENTESNGKYCKIKTGSDT